MTHDAIVLGAGPAGLGAALALARAGARVALLEAAEQVGGMCVTFRRDDLAYDLGGHILFVHDEARRAWLEELLGTDLIWVERPVACVLDGEIRRGRYLDQRPDGARAANGGGPSARQFLDESFGAAFVDRVMRDYLEKVDGMPLESITAARARKLMHEQYAPEGFWYAAGGVGQLMDAMAAEIVRHGGELRCSARVRAIRVAGGRVAGVDAQGPEEEIRLSAPRVIAGLPAAAVARLVDPPPPDDVTPVLPPRAAAIVYLVLQTDRLTPEAWIQVADPRVPFARMFEAKNWSERLVPPGQTVLGCEVYCSPTPGDPWWGLDDEALGAACAAALDDPLGLGAAAESVRTLEVVRLGRAWSPVRVDAVAESMAPANWLAGIEGLSVAQGGDVVLAVAAGEAAAGS